MNNQNFQGISMTTGFSNNTNTEDEYIENETIKVIMIMDDALRLSSRYTKHANRRGIGPKDIILALKVRGYYNDEFMSSPDTYDKFQNFKNILDEALNEEEEEMEEDLIINTEEVWNESNCNCQLCSTMNNIDNLWGDWDPTDVVGIRNKRAVQTAIEKMGL